MKDLFINQCITTVRQAYTEEYKSLSDQLRLLSAEELYKKVIAQIKSKSTKYKTKSSVDGIMFTNLLTIGCPRWVKNGQVEGCSFCNYIDVLMPQITMMSVLKEKSESFYKDAIIQSFIMLRVNNKENALIEGITGFDNFNTDEIPCGVLDSISCIIKENNHIKPFQYIFESRASSITFEKLADWKNKIGKRAIIELGIETSNEWIRNNWFNKDIYNYQIEEAVASIKKVGWKVSGNVLLGIPGLSIRESISSFFKSIRWLKDQKFDHIVFSPLTKKENTLQDVLYRLRDNSRLQDIGIVYGEQTGNLPITVLIEAIPEIEKEGYRFFREIFVSPISWNNYKVSILRSERNAKNKVFLKKAIDMLDEYFRMKDLSIITNFYDEYRNTNEYLFFNQLGSINKEKGTAADYLLSLAEEIAVYLWPQNWACMIEEFKKELVDFNESIKESYVF